MIREEIRRLSLGARLRLVAGDIVEVKSINPQDETITFVYREPSGAGDPPMVTPLWGAAPASNRLSVQGAVVVPGGIPPAPGGTFSMEEEETKEKGTIPTTVKCGWVELGNVVLAEDNERRD